MRSMRYLIVILIALVFAMLPTRGHGATVSVEVGLDDATRYLIRRLPIELREQFVQAVKESLALVDVSVNQHLTRIDEILQSKIDALRCQISGGSRDVLDGLKQIIEEIKPFSNKDRSNLLDSIKIDVEALRRQIKIGSTSEDLVQTYASILYRIGIAACQASIDKTAEELVRKFEAKYAPAARIWMFLFGKCANQLDCYTKRHAEIQEFISKSDARDVRKADAIQSFAAMPKPESNPGFLGPRLPSLDEFERRLIALRRIELGVNTQKYLRKIEAEKLWDAINKKVDKFETQEKAVWALTHGGMTNVILDSRTCVNVYRQMIKDLSAIISDSRKALPVDEEIGRDAWSKAKDRLQRGLDRVYPNFNECVKGMTIFSPPQRRQIPPLEKIEL